MIQICLNVIFFHWNSVSTLLLPKHPGIHTALTLVVGTTVGNPGCDKRWHHQAWGLQGFRGESILRCDHGPPHRGKVSIAHGAKPWRWRPPQWHHQHSLFGYQGPPQTKDIILYQLQKIRPNSSRWSCLKLSEKNSTENNIQTQRWKGKIKRTITIMNHNTCEMVQRIPCKHPLSDRNESRMWGAFWRT